MIDELRMKLKTAMVEKNNHARDMLRLLLGEVDRKNKATEEDVKQIVKKIIINNTETINQATDRQELRNKLEAENVFFSSLLPGLLTGNALRNEIMPLADQIRMAKGEGQATGLVIKTLKSKNLDFFGDEVNNLVKELRQ